jgi:hypothetical protein
VDERAPAGRRITPLLIEDGYEVRHLLPDGGETPYPAYELRGAAFVAGCGENALSGLRTTGYCFCCRIAAKTPYPAYELRGTAFVAGWRRKRLIRPTNCRVQLLLPDGGETPYPAYVWRGVAFVAGWRRKALSGLHVGFCFCRPDKRSAIRQFTKPGQRED